jgi:deoxyribodipyrimidine photo-lyase
MRTLLLFTRDLRVHDHPALDDAVRGGEVVPMFALEPSLLAASANRTRFLLESLADLDGALRRRGSRLHLRRGDAAVEAVRTAVGAGCDALAVTSDHSRFAIRRADALREACRTAGIRFRTSPGHTVVEPGDVAPAGGDHYSVFTPYHRAWLSSGRRPVLPAPRAIRTPEGIAAGRMPARVAPDSSIPAGGETAGRAALASWLRSGLAGYVDGHDDLGEDRTSRLSPYLRFGCVSPNEVAARALDRGPHDPAGAFVRQLCWRDFFLQLLAAVPTLPDRSLRRGPAVSPPIDPDRAFEAWARGRTGIPLVDAGMRQLAREGWMHNRARLVAGNFLTKRLGVWWRRGYEHFSRLLVDGDVANNAGNWQWVAGTAVDTRPNRVFNPVRQARRFDPNGAYVRRHVAELADAPDHLVLEPWTDAAFLRRSGFADPIVPVTISSARTSR